MHDRKGLGLAIPIIFTIIGSMFIGNALGEGEPCHECHGNDGDYTFESLSVRSHTARVIDPGAEFEHIIEIKHPGGYDAKSVTIEIDLDSAPNLVLLDNTPLIIDLMTEGTKKINIKMKAKEPLQSQKIRTTVTYSADYHYDPTQYTEILDISVTIDRLLLSPSTWSVNLRTGDKEKIEIGVLDTVQNVVILPSDSLEGVVKIDYEIPKLLSKGNTFSINVKGQNPGSGKLNIIYEDDSGQAHKAILDVIVTQKVQDKGSLWVQVGMITGLTSWILLFISVIVGAPVKKFKPALNKVFRNAHVRKEFHCGICYILVILALFHAVVVMTTYWQGTMLGLTYVFANSAMNYGLYINLGTTSWLLMIIVSVTGIFYKPLIKLIKYNAWRWTHNIITVVALVTALVHGLVMLDFRLF